MLTSAGTTDYNRHVARRAELEEAAEGLAGSSKLVKLATEVQKLHDAQEAESKMVDRLIHHYKTFPFGTGLCGTNHSNFVSFCCIAGGTVAETISLVAALAQLIFAEEQHPVVAAATTLSIVVSGAAIVGGFIMNCCGLYATKRIQDLSKIEFSTQDTQDLLNLLEFLKSVAQLDEVHDEQKIPTAMKCVGDAVDKLPPSCHSVKLFSQKEELFSAVVRSLSEKHPLRKNMGLLQQYYDRDTQEPTPPERPVSAPASVDHEEIAARLLADLEEERNQPLEGALPVDEAPYEELWLQFEEGFGGPISMLCGVPRRAIVSKERSAEEGLGPVIN